MKLPPRLNAAFDWTDAAGELDQLRTLTSWALVDYCKESAANWRAQSHPDSTNDPPVTDADLASLHDWLVEKHALENP